MATRNATFEREAPPWETWDRNHLGVWRDVVLLERRSTIAE